MQASEATVRPPASLRPPRRRAAPRAAPLALRPHRPPPLGLAGAARAAPPRPPSPPPPGRGGEEPDRRVGALGHQERGPPDARVRVAPPRGRHPHPRLGQDVGEAAACGAHHRHHREPAGRHRHQRAAVRAARRAQVCRLHGSAVRRRPLHARHLYEPDHQAGASQEGGRSRRAAPPAGPPRRTRRADAAPRALDDAHRLAPPSAPRPLPAPCLGVFPITDCCPFAPSLAATARPPARPPARSSRSRAC